MSTYNISGRVFIVKNYYLSDPTVIRVQRKWSTEFRNKQKSSSAMINNLIEKFVLTGSVADEKEAVKDKSRPVRSPYVIETAKKVVESNPHISTRQVGQQIGTRIASTHHIELHSRTGKCTMRRTVYRNGLLLEITEC